MSKGLRRGALYGGIAIAALVVGATIVVLNQQRGAAEKDASGTAPLTDRMLAQRFAVLSRAHSNQCGLVSVGLDRLAKDGRLQGSCCTAMNFERYVEQVTGLRRYAAVAEIPADPYDISVDLAKRLIAYDENIRLTPSQRIVYNRAVRLSEEGGPCCCHCWRWAAFEGQAEFLIAHRGYQAQRIAKIWGLEDGCGGRGHANMT